MAQKLLPEPHAAWSKVLPQGLFTWLKQLHARVNENVQILWGQIDASDASLSDIGGRSHQLLTSILPADDSSTDTTQNRHISDAQAKAWEDHKDASSNVHGATGAVIGSGNTATTSSVGVVLQTTAVSDLNLSVSATYTPSEIQAISDKVDQLLGAMRTSGQLDT